MHSVLQRVIFAFTTYNYGMYVVRGREIVVTNDVDVDVSRDRGDIILKLQAVGAFVWTDARRDGQLCVRGLCHHGDALISGCQLLLSKGPLGNRGWVSSDGDSDGKRLRCDHLQAFPEGTQVQGWTNFRERKMFYMLASFTQTFTQKEVG